MDIKHKLSTIIDIIKNKISVYQKTDTSDEEYIAYEKEINKIATSDSDDSVCKNYETESLDKEDIQQELTNNIEVFDINDIKDYLNNLKNFLEHTDFLTMIEEFKKPNSSINIFTHILLHYNECLDYIKIFIYNKELFICTLLCLYKDIKNVDIHIDLALLFLKQYDTIISLWDAYSNKDNNNLLLFLIDNIKVKTMLIIYGYYYYINKFILLETRNYTNIIELISYTFDITITKSNINELYPNTNINDILLLIFNKNIFGDTTKNNLLRNISDFITQNHKDILNNKIEHQKIQSNTNINQLLFQILNIINVFINKPRTQYETIDTFITIPQYVGNCWYISMITGICYSDRSRKLLQKSFTSSRGKIEIKEDDIHYDKIISANTNNLFINFIKYVIYNITSKQLYYKSPLEKNCEYFKQFKDNQTNYLIKMYEELFTIFKDFENINLDMFRDESAQTVNIKLDAIGTDIYYDYIGSVIYHYYNIYYNNFKNIINKRAAIINKFAFNANVTIRGYNREIACLEKIRNKSETQISKLNTIKQKLEDLNTQVKDNSQKLFATLSETESSYLSTISESFSISRANYIILAYLYNLLNITTLFLYKTENPNIYCKSMFDIYSNNNPDVIIINNLDLNFLSDDQTTINENLKKINLYTPDDNFKEYHEIILLNGNVYVLDYMLINNDNSICTTNGDCGHCISAITYNNKKYLYNSQYNVNNNSIITTVECDGDTNIKIPCSLIQQDWNTYDNEFCMRKCYYKKITSSAAIREESYDGVSHLCYSNIHKNTVKIYIKLGSLSDIGVSITDEERVIKQKIKEYEAITEAKLGGANKKVKIIINKKIINRVVFKNRYVKINNNNVDLSNFKYSKKYDVYYIKKSDLNIL